MKKVSKIVDDNYLYLRASLITFIFVYALLKLARIDFSDIFALGLIIIISVLLICMKKVNIKYFCIILVSLMFIYGSIFGFDKIIELMIFLGNSFLWIIKYVKDGQQGEFSYYIVDTIFVGTLMMLLICYLQKYSKTVIILDTLIVLFMVASTIGSVNWSAFAVCISLFTVFESVVQIVQKRTNKKYKGTYLFPFIAITVVLVCIMPTNEKPLKWQLARNVIAKTSEKISDISYELSAKNYDDTEMVTTGFSEENVKFFSKISDGNSSTVLKVKPDSIMANRVYLSGIIRDEYTGNGFSDTVSSLPSIEDEYRMDLFEKLYNLKLSNIQSSDEKFCKRITYSISYYNLKTDRIFVPQDLNHISLIDSNVNLSAKGFNNFFSRRLKRKDVYYVTAAAMNMDNPDIIKYLRSLDGFSYQNAPDLENTSKSSKEQDKSNNSSLIGYDYYNSGTSTPDEADKTLFNECSNELCLSEHDLDEITSKDFKQILCDRSNEIKQKYSSLPEEVPEEVYELSKEITKDKTNNYDRVMAIYEYLKDFNYTKEPGNIEDGEDIVYNFLFKKKEGYCSYFAGAVTVMCRCIGIPSRYVEGVSVDLNTDYLVWNLANNDTCHAWSEIYLEGFGWIKIDATPGYNNEEVDWNKSNEVSYTTQGKAEESTYKSEGKVIDKAKNNLIKVLSWWQYALSFFVCVILMGLICVISYYFKNLYVYRKSDNNQKIKINISILLKKLNRKKYGITNEETLNDYKNRLAKFDEFDEKKDILKLIKWFEKVRYSDYLVSDEEVKWAEKIIKIKIK